MRWTAYRSAQDDAPACRRPPRKPGGARPHDMTCVRRGRTLSQAFRIGRSLAVQFHPEVTVPVVETWLAYGAAKNPEEGGVPDGLLDRTEEVAPAADRQAHDLVDAFVGYAALT